MAKWLAFLLTVAMLGFVLASCGTTPGKNESPKLELPILRVAVMPYLCSLPVVHMINKGWDVENGFKLQTSVFAEGASMNQALGANLWDVGTIGAAGVFGVANYGAIAIGDIEYSTGGDGAFIRPTHRAAKIKGAVSGYPGVYGNAATLKGSTVLVPTGSVSQLNALKWIEVVGLPKNDVKVVSMDYSSAFQAFKAGQGDIVALVPPLAYSARDAGWVNGGSLEELKVDMYDTLLANDRSLKDEQKKASIIKFVRQFYRACDELAANPEVAAQTELKWQKDNGLKSTIENAREEVKSRPFLTSGKVKQMPTAETVKLLATFFASIGTLEKEQLNKFNDKTLTKDIINEALK
jgi:NitT/TauT family transport system substrate-binding protein